MAVLFKKLKKNLGKWLCLSSFSINRLSTKPKRNWKRKKRLNKRLKVVEKWKFQKVGLSRKLNRKWVAWIYKSSFNINKHSINGEENKSRKQKRQQPVVETQRKMMVHSKRKPLMRWRKWQWLNSFSTNKLLINGKLSKKKRQILHRKKMKAALKKKPLMRWKKWQWLSNFSTNKHSISGKLSKKKRLNLQRKKVKVDLSRKLKTRWRKWRWLSSFNIKEPWMIIKHLWNRKKLLQRRKKKRRNSHLLINLKKKKPNLFKHLNWILEQSRKKMKTYQTMWSLELRFSKTLWNQSQRKKKRILAQFLQWKSRQLSQR